MSKRVLIVDDAAFMRMMIKSVLEKNDFEIVGEADCGEKGIEMFKQLKPDVVTMDITMPGIGGIEAVREIMKVDNGARVVMCSAMGQQAMVLEAIQLGAKDFIVKPFNQERILTAVRNAVN
jgi:two-component system chemotaxis response regulator CheY